MRAKEELKIKFSFNKRQQYRKPFSLNSNERKLSKTLHVIYIIFQYGAVMYGVVITALYLFLSSMANAKKIKNL